MGCDIHMFLERKRSTDKKWQLDSHHEVYTEDDETRTSEVYSGRSYELFGHLAGVRYMANKVIPKGIPKNASKGFKIACAQLEEDTHSHSYISIERYAKILDRVGMGDDIDLATYEFRDPFAESQIYRSDHPFHIVLAYVHDIKESNAVNYILTHDPDYLDEKFRLMFFFDS